MYDVINCTYMYVCIPLLNGTHVVMYHMYVVCILHVPPISTCTCTTHSFDVQYVV